MMWENFIVCMVLVFLSLMSSVIPLIIGEIKKKSAIKTNEYYPPQGASPVEVLLGYYGKRANPRDIFNPLMLYWAQNGFITIEEDCRRGFKLTKLKDLTWDKNREVTCVDTYSTEKELFNYIFKNGDVFYTLNADDGFKKKFDSLKLTCESDGEEVSGKKSRKAMVFSTVVSIFVLVAVSVINLIGGNELGFIMLFPVVAIIFLRFAFLSLESSSPKFMMIPFFALWGGVPFIAVVAASPPLGAIALGVATGVTFINLFFLSRRIDLRDEDHIKFYAKICGFKKFLVMAELRKLEMLVEEDPQYFYEILPYCYVLKITKKMKPVFDRIIMDGPGWYLGDMRETLMF